MLNEDGDRGNSLLLDGLASVVVVCIVSCLDDITTSAGWITVALLYDEETAADEVAFEAVTVADEVHEENQDKGAEAGAGAVPLLLCGVSGAFVCHESFKLLFSLFIFTAAAVVFCVCAAGDDPLDDWSAERNGLKFIV